MPNTEAQNHATAVPQLTPNGAVEAPFSHDVLEALFAEVAALANQLRKAAASASRPDRSPAGSWGILRILERLGPQSVPSIARMRALSRQNIQVSVNRLQTRGLVALAPNPAHKRSALVELTDRGRSELAAIAEREASSNAALLPYLVENRLVRAASLLHQLRELLSGHKLPAADPSGGPQPTQRVSNAPTKPTRRRRPASVRAEAPPLPEPSELDESEFPVNLL